VAGSYSLIAVYSARSRPPLIFKDVGACLGRNGWGTVGPAEKLEEAIIRLRRAPGVMWCAGHAEWAQHRRRPPRICLAAADGDVKIGDSPPEKASPIGDGRCRAFRVLDRRESRRADLCRTLAEHGADVFERSPGRTCRISLSGIRYPATASSPLI